jgi:hypothetical protein
MHALCFGGRDHNPGPAVWLSATSRLSATMQSIIFRSRGCRGVLPLGVIDFITRLVVSYAPAISMGLVNLGK